MFSVYNVHFTYSYSDNTCSQLTKEYSSTAMAVLSWHLDNCTEYTYFLYSTALTLCTAQNAREAFTKNALLLQFAVSVLHLTYS